MATLEEMSRWLAAHKDQQETPEFAKVVKAYQALRAKSNMPQSQDYAPVSAYAKGALGGVNTSLMETLGAPVDLANAALKPIGLGSDYPIGGSQSLKDLTNKVLGWTQSDRNLFSEGPDDALGRTLNRAGQTIGTGAIPAAGITGAAVKQGARVLKKAPSVISSFLEPIARSPIRASAGEAAALTTSGLGAGIAREKYPDNKMAEFYGELAGGFAPSVMAHTPTALGARLAGGVVKRFMPSVLRENALKAVRTDLARELGTPEATEAIKQSSTIKREIPGFEPSLAEASNAQGLIAKQRDLENAMTGFELDAAVSRRRANERAVEQYAAQNSPPSGYDPHMVAAGARRRVDTLKGGIDTEYDLLQRARQGVARNIPQADLADEGFKLRTALGERLGEESEAWSKVATDYGLNDDNLMIPFSNFRKELLDSFAASSKIATKSGKRVAADPSIVSVIRNTKDIQSFPALTEVRSDISHALRDAKKTPGVDSVTIRGIENMRDTFDAALERAVVEAGDPDLVRRYADFRQGYLKNVVEPFKQMASQKILRKDVTGAYIVPDEKVTQFYFKPGGATAAKQFRKAFPDNATANEAIKASALDSVSKNAVKDGVVDPKLLRKWLEVHDSVLKEFPDIAKDIGKLAADNSILVKRQATLNARKEIVENSLLARELKSMDRSGATPEAFIGRAMKSPNLMVQVSNRLRGKPEALNALRRHIWDSVADLPPGGLLDFIDKNKTMLRSAGMNQKHLDALKTIDGARIIMGRTPMPTGSAKIPGPVERIKEVTGLDPAMAMNRLHTFKTGRSEKWWVVTNLISNVITNKARGTMDRAYRVVLYDPEAAIAMAQALGKGPVGPSAKRLGARWFAYGVTLASDDEQEQ